MNSKSTSISLLQRLTGGNCTKNRKEKTMKRDYIFITRNRKKLYLDTFKRNVLMPIAFLLGIAVFFATTWLMFLLAYVFQG